MNESSDTPVGLVVSHTHWDREWRMPVWGSRRRLVRMMDGLLDHIERHPEYRGFLLDGQVIALEDYIEARPEQEERVRTLIRDDRLHIGPWYNLPDEFPVSGESLIRNLMTGIRKAESWGGVMRVGYTPFGWGQTAQLPQIYAGFDIDFIMLGKHVSRARAPRCEFLWQAPDGTQVLTTRLGSGARANFYFSVVLPVLYGKAYRDEQWGFVWPGQGWYVHAADHARAFAEPELDPQFEWKDKGLLDAARAAWDTMSESMVSNCRFLGDGVDYSGPTPHLQKFMDAINEAQIGFLLRHGTLPEYAAHVRAALQGVELTVVNGELRDGPAQSVSANALMVRPRQVAESGSGNPFATLCRTVGGHVECAWCRSAGIVPCACVGLFVEVAFP
jgi:mannosylglycerate hydrolase